MSNMKAMIWRRCWATTSSQVKHTVSIWASMERFFPAQPAA
jgi:hypothetical protein